MLKSGKKREEASFVKEEGRREGRSSDEQEKEALGKRQQSPEGIGKVWVLGEKVEMGKEFLL